MTARNQWSQGLQWGACTWLGYVTARAVVQAVQASLHGFHAPQLLLAAVWLTALALAWTRGSRAGVAAALVVQAAVGTMEASRYAGEMHASWALTFWLPMSLPLLPLLFIEPERPRRTLALLAMGRWRDAVADLAGWRWLVVAAAVLMLNRSGWRALEGIQSGRGWAAAFAAPVLLFVLAAIPRLRPPATA